MIIYDKMRGSEHDSALNYRNDAECINDFVKHCQRNGITKYGKTAREITDNITLQEITFEYFGKKGVYQYHIPFNND